MDTKCCVVSANPGVDRMIYLAGPLCEGGMNRVARVELCAGSKGANVALLLRHLGVKTAYVGISGGSFGEICNAFLTGAGIPCRLVETAAGVRMNVKLIDPAGTATECNERGGPFGEEEVRRLFDAVQAEEAEIFFLCGSLPQGVPENGYAEMTRAIRKKHPAAKVVLDTSGQAFRAAMADQPPDTIKPNLTELSELFGVPEPTGQTEILALCRLCRETYPQTNLICTLGKAGAVYCGGEGAFLVEQPPVEKPRCTVGAGDTFLGGFFAAKQAGKDTKEALRFAAAAAAVHVTLLPGELPRREEICRVAQTVRVRPMETPEGPPAGTL